MIATVASSVPNSYFLLHTSSRRAIPPFVIRSKAAFWVFLLVAVYAAAHALWYSQTALGQSPALDGLENLQLAGEIARGELPAEPFYRAMLYPALLAATGGSWMLLGFACHLANAFLAYRLARALWRREIPALVAAALTGFNPVLLHYAFDPLDTTLSITLLLAGLNALFAALPRERRRPVGPEDARRRLLWAIAAGLCLALAGLARPHAVAILPPLAVLALGASVARKVAWSQTLAFCGALALPLLAYGAIQKARSGDFAILPWQGAYNLWASNRPGASGLYYQQSLNLHYTSEHQNPTRLESEILYRQQTGEPGDIDSQSAYWREKTFESIRARPAEWLRLMAFKAYALVNDYEQYNNKTYAFHKELAPWLRYNPLGWGLLLVAATLSVSATLARPSSSASTSSSSSSSPALLLILVILAYSAGILVYMASGRFRAPLIPLLAVLASGIPLAFARWRALSRSRQTGACAAAALAAFLAYSTFGDVSNPRTRIQDTLLYADAAARLGRDRETIDWANGALALDPERQAAKRLRLIAEYNLVASGEIVADAALWSRLAQEAATIELEDARFDFVKGVALWNAGGRDRAARHWQGSYGRFGMEASSCLGALALSAPSILPSEPPPELLAALRAGGHPILAFAVVATQPEARREALLVATGLSPERYAAIAVSLARVLPGLAE